MATKGTTKPKAADRSEERKTVVTGTDGVKKYKCQYCGKWIKFDSWEEFEAGDYCHQLREEKGFTDATLAEHRASMSADEVPVTSDGREYIKVASLDRMLKQKGIPVSRMVKAFGGDRTIDGPMHPKFQPVYVGRARYLHPDCGEQWGLDYLQNTVGGRSGNSKPKNAEVKEVEDALS
jgi:hypothetical protein